MTDDPRIMTQEQACRKILGEDLADSIITDMGLHWALVSAVSMAKTDDDPQALATLRTYLDKCKASRP